MCALGHVYTCARSGTQMRPCVLWDTHVPCVLWDTDAPVRALGHTSARACSGTHMYPCVFWDTDVPVHALGHVCISV